MTKRNTRASKKTFPECYFYTGGNVGSYVCFQISEVCGCQGDHFFSCSNLVNYLNANDLLMVMCTELQKDLQKK